MISAAYHSVDESQILAKYRAVLRLGRVPLLYVLV